MSENNVKYTEIQAELKNSLHQGYDGERAKAVEDCSVSESAISYAFEELGPEERQKVEDHLQSCRSCMNLVLDARAADIESQETAGHQVKILPRLSAAITRAGKTGNRVQNAFHGPKDHRNRSSCMYCGSY